METTTNSYSYQTLPADGSQIRFVTLLAGEGDAPIECTLSHYAFANSDSHAQNAEFEALSYVWGDPTATTPIILGCERFRVTRNLAVALQALRHPDAPRLLWIDAICINQSSRAERAQEVRRMGAIYRAAARVIIWLGRDAEPGDQPLRLDRHVSELTHVILNKLADCGSSDRDYDAAASVLHATGDLNLAVLLLLRFFSRPWWLRVWILQEVALAKTAIVVYGSGTLSWLHGPVDAIRFKGSPYLINTLP